MTRKGSASAPSATAVTTLTEETPMAMVETTPDTNWTDLDAVKIAYQAADPAGKAALRKAAEKALRDAVTHGDLVTAQTVISAQSVMVAKAATKVSEPVDYAKLIKVQVATHLRAAQLMVTNVTLPDGTPEDFDTKIFADDDDRLYALNGVVAALRADLSDDDWDKIIHTSTEMVHKAKIGAGTKAARKEGGVAAHIEDVYATLDKSTFLTVAAIAKIQTDTYGDTFPSTGAVAARLGAATFNMDGVTPYAKGETLPNGTTAPAAGAWFEV